MKPRTEIIARAAKMRALRAQGLSWTEIAERYGITAHTVRALLRRHLEPPSAGRVWWRPDAELLAVARSIRREIEQAEGFRRPPV